jgi:ribonucleoside-diphosphate reductase alpha chain
MKIQRRFTQTGQDPLDGMEWEKRESVIREPDGKVVFEMRDIEVPTSWSQVATDILAQKYFRKAGVPQPDGSLGRETSLRQVVRRLAGCWTDWGRRYNYFDSADDAAAFDAEMTYMLANQMAAPNSPQWFNTGLAYAYGIKGSPQGHYYVDPDTKELTRSEDSYTHIQGHACFIQSVDDDLVNDNGIMDLWVREARIFKMGSGSGTNYSNLRGEGEPLAGGGTSSGLMSFLRVGDRAAGAIKSGGTTRRAAKMVVLDMDHPDIEKFINWKVNEEKKVAALIAAGYDSSYEGDAYQTVAGQNSNNSVRVPDSFIDAVRNDGTWDLTWRTDGRVIRTMRARDLWGQVANAAWACADPGVQFDDIINSWHTCPVGGRIRASNPCSEYLHLDDTGCNLASLNLMKFFDTERNVLDVESLAHAIRLWTIALEITVLMAHFPSKKIARKSYEYRQLGLGYANLGTVLMVSGIPYDSPRALALCGAATALLTGESYATSAEMASEIGPFPRYHEETEAMLRVMRNHRRAAYNAPADEYEGVRIVPMGIDPSLCPPYLLAAARDCWDRAVSLGKKHGYRNSQATVLAPTGTIGLLMGCDTTGVEPDFALVKFKKLSGGGYFKIINESIPLALLNLGYAENQVQDIIRYVNGSASLYGAPYVNQETLRARGLDDGDIRRIEIALPSVFEIAFAFNRTSLGDDALRRLGISTEAASAPDFNLLREIGFSIEEIHAANDYICGTMTIEGAPHLKEEHYPVFDCANKCGKKGRRFIHHMGHVRMMAAAQPFISGGISKCVVGDTLITTERGLIRIGSLSLGEEPDSFRPLRLAVASLDKTRATDAYYSGGRRPVKEIRLRSGHKVVGTPNHRVLCCDENGLEWRALSDIDQGDFVAIQHGNDMWASDPPDFEGFEPSELYGSQKATIIPDQMTDELAFFLGAYCAEGHTSRTNYTICIANTEENVLARLSSAAKSLFGLEPHLQRAPGKWPTLNLSSKTLVEFLEYLGCGERAAFKRIPDKVLQSPKSMMLSFLAGLSLDSYMPSNDVKWAICLDASGLLDDLQAVLTNLGIVHSRISKFNAVYQKSYDEVYASGRFAQKLVAQIKFMEPHKVARAAEIAACNLGQSAADVIPGISGRTLYDLIPAGTSGRGSAGRVRTPHTHLLDSRTKNVSWESVRRLQEMPGVHLPGWLDELISRNVHFSPVDVVRDAGEQNVYDLSVPESHAFVGNGIVNHNTINMPSEVSVADVQEVYMRSWELGVKAIALYRDGSKLSQPLSNKGTDKTSDKAADDRQLALSPELEEQLAAARKARAEELGPDEILAAAKRILANATNTDFKRKVAQALERNRLPAKRRGWTQKAKIAGHTVFLRTGEYADGTLGEIFVDLHKEGASFRSLMNCFAIAVSIGLQYGVPLEEFVEKFTFTRFEPNGFVDHPNVKYCTSVIDYIFRVLGMEYLGRTDFVQVKPEDRDVDDPHHDDHAIAEFDALVSAQQAADEPKPGPMKRALPADAETSRSQTAAAKSIDPNLAQQLNALRSQQAQLASMMGDAPLCDTCGSLTRRNGACYVCDSCGRSMGCS